MILIINMNNSFFRGWLTWGAPPPRPPAHPQVFFTFFVIFDVFRPRDPQKRIGLDFLSGFGLIIIKKDVNGVELRPF